jgi:DNA invertase Pin-like site-specific DNA recombinase
MKDGVYDARLADDRFLLGMNRTMSEMELSLFRQRVSEARMLKAKRSELFATIAVGYRKVANRISACYGPLAASGGHRAAKHRIRSTRAPHRMEIAGLSGCLT